MICFDVYVNGEKLCRAGLSEALVLSSIFSWVKLPSGDEEMLLEVAGLYEPEPGGNAHPHWIKNLELKTGDEITIKILDSETADEPVAETIWTSEDIEKHERNYFESVKTKFEDKKD